MKLVIQEMEGSRHKKVVTDTGVKLGLFYLDISGFYYFDPYEDRGLFAAHSLRDIANLLDEINEPYNKQINEDLGMYEVANSKIGRVVTIKDRGEVYSTYWEMFQELGFKSPDKVKELKSVYPEKEDYKGAIFTIFNEGMHRDEKGVKLYAIRDEKGNEFLFSRKGLRFKKV
jgi:hypothetical protein